MRVKLRPWLWLGLPLVACGLAAAETGGGMKDNAQEYLALRQTLKAATLTAQQAAGPRAPWRGKKVELYGRIVGRTNSCAVGQASVISFMLQTPGVPSALLVDSEEDNPLILVDQVVHVLAELPESARPTDHFLMKAIIAEADLPADEQKHALAEAEARRLAEAAKSGAPKDPAQKTQADDGGTNTLKPGAAGSQIITPVSPSDQGTNPVSPPQQVITPRPGTEPPQVQPRLASNTPAKTIEVWKQWVANANAKLSDDQSELIVRAVIYYSALYGVDHRLSFAMIYCESEYDPRSLSHSGAMGLTQLMPGTAKCVGCNDPWDLEQNIRGGIQYLSEQLHSYVGRPNYEQFALGMASYNAGPNAVKRAGGVPNIPETVRYVDRVGKLFYKLYKEMP